MCSKFQESLERREKRSLCVLPCVLYVLCMGRGRGGGGEEEGVKCFSARFFVYNLNFIFYEAL